MLTFKSKIEKVRTASPMPNGLEIFERIKETLREARSSIKIAAGWFTDDELFQILMEKKRFYPGCKIEIVLDDNKENYWLPFADLVKNGATVKLSGGVGPYGRMIEKFCIVDNSVVISGSYNWSKNSRTMQHENFIVSSIPEVIAGFDSRFKELLDASSDFDAEQIKRGGRSETAESAKQDERPDFFAKEFEQVLDHMIFSSVAEYDREELKQNGFDRSEKCAGDSTVINNELNTVYTEMMNTISFSEQRKEGLKAKVNTYLQASKFALLEKCARDKEQLQIEEDILAKAKENEINVLEDDTKRNAEEIIKLEQSEIVANENRIRQLKEEKRSIQEETLKMPFRCLVDVPTYIGLFLVLSYLVLFYSSAAYILMFSERNAKEAAMFDQIPEPMGIFYSGAIPDAAAKNFYELVFILLVPVFLVYGLIYMKKAIFPKYLPKTMVKVLCIIAVDGFIAISVAKSLHEIDYLTGKVSDHFKLSQVFLDMNFYLVFIFGMLALLSFDVVLSYYLRSLESRNDVHLNAKKRVNLKVLDEDISFLERKNSEYTAEVLNKRRQIEHLNQKIETLKKEAQTLSAATSRKKGLIENETTGQLTNLENIVAIAYNKIENELFSFSIHFIKDRINVFLQGWNNFIYSYYAKPIAEEKVRQAREISGIWFNDNFYNTTNLKTYRNEIAI